MHNALRAHENPALDVAIRLAGQNGLPLLVYQGLVEDYPYASDRLHSFILQGHRDAARELRDRGIDSVCHVQTRDDRASMLGGLFDQSAVLVTEQMPIEPLVGWIDCLVAKSTVPIVSVDATCLVPSSANPIGDWLDRHCEDRSYNVDDYRDCTRTLYDGCVDQPYPAEPCEVFAYDGDTPIKSMNLGEQNLAQLIGRCRIDHSIPPVIEMPGGRRAGYRLWNQFLESGAGQEPETVLIAAEPPPVGSLVSAYLHFGMISPFRLAREAAANGRRQFLDNLLVWRESAFHFCSRYSVQIDTTEAIPRWATETLQDHHDDQRLCTASWETLLRGCTMDPKFNNAQRSLARRGTLSGDFRKRWGKSLLNLTRTPEQAFQSIIDLNHRLSLDGRDPNSYGGILSCLGQFDEPQSIEAPVFGTVRQPEDVLLSEPNAQPLVVKPRQHRVAIIGAGMGGLVAARTLQDQGFDVTVFEKSRGVGGRLATRRTDLAVTFDHGASVFTATDGRFMRYVRSWIQDGLVECWDGRFVRLDNDGEISSAGETSKTGSVCFVGIPTNNSIAKHLAEDLTIHRSTRIVAADRINGDDMKHVYRLKDESDKRFGPFDSVICNLPPVQAAALVDAEVQWASRLDPTSMVPCWTMMLVADFSPLPFDAATVDGDVIAWLSRDDAKPGRSSVIGESKKSTCWVIQASANWSGQHLEADPQWVGDALVTELQRLLNRSIGDIQFQRVHRWRYAQLESHHRLDDSEEAWFDPSTMWGACGDWISGGNVEGAFLSGQAVAGALMRHLTIDRPVS